MADGRFQVVSVPRCAAEVPLPSEPEGGAGSANTRDPVVCAFSWRFLSANNRTMARSGQASPDVESCLAAIRLLQEGLSEAVAETSRNGNGQWVWQVRLGDEVVARATRSYVHQVRARLTCDSFLQLVAQTAPSTALGVRCR